jgi:hypothetical protein
MVTRPITVGVALLIGCSSARVLAPVIDLPSSRPALPIPDITELELSIAHSGQSQALVTKTFKRGDAIEITDAPLGDDLVIHMTGRIGGSDVAYGRSCVFSATSNAPLPAPHIYFSRTRSWASIAGVPNPQRTDGRATTYHDGRAMFLSGIDGTSTPISTVDEFNPSTGAFATVTNIAPRIAPLVATLGDGRILLGGGRDTATQRAATFVELIEADNSEEGRLVRLEQELLAVRDGAATELSDGRILLFGGALTDVVTPTGRVVFVDAAENAVTSFQARSLLATPRLGHTATRLSDDRGAMILIAGGTDATGSPVANAELFKPLRETFVSIAGNPATMVVPRHHHTAIRMPDGSVLIIGGMDAAGQPVRRIELFTLDGGFVDVGALPAGAGAIGFSATTLPDGRVMIAGGQLQQGGPAVSSAFVAGLDLGDGTVSIISIENMATARAGHEAVLLCDGTVMLVGGTATNSSAERYNPPSAGRR